MSFTVPIAEWLEWHTEKQGVAGSIPVGGIYFHFEFCAYFPMLTAQRRPYKWNQAWHSSRVIGAQDRFNILKKYGGDLLNDMSALIKKKYEVPH